MTNNTLETMIQQKQPTAPRITPEHIEGLIKETHFFTAAQGCYGKAHQEQTAAGWDSNLNRVTICTMILQNGFVIVGTSAAVNVENFDAELGIMRARQKAVEQIWPLAGFLLAEDQHRKALDEWAAQQAQAMGIDQPD